VTAPPIEMSVLLTSGVVVASVAASWASLRQHLLDKEVRDNARFDRIEKKVGITNGGAIWVDKEFCHEVHRSFSEEVEGLKASNESLAEKVEHAVEVGNEAIRVGHEDRMTIKARLVVVEERVAVAARKADEAVLVARDESLGIQRRLTAVESTLRTQ
jgi:hypothetical protein